MSKWGVLVFVAFVLVGAVAPIPAKANSIDTFVFQTCEGVQSSCGPGLQSFNNTYTWQAPASPSPSTFNPNTEGGAFSWFTIIANVTANGTDIGPTTISFNAATPFDGPFFQISASPVSANGFVPQIWTGPDSAPTFIPGSYAVVWPISPVGTLTITSSSVAEPSVLLQTGAGLLVGLAVIAFARKQDASLTVP